MDTLIFRIGTEINYFGNFWQFRYSTVLIGRTENDLFTVQA